VRAGHAGDRDVPGVSCPGPLLADEAAAGVGDEVSPDDVAEPALERTDRFARGVTFGELAFVVATAGTVPVADLGDRRAVQSMVRTTLPRRDSRWVTRPPEENSSGAVPV
jgi:hypothetical protein